MRSSRSIILGWTSPAIVVWLLHGCAYHAGCLSLATAFTCAALVCVRFSMAASPLLLSRCFTYADGALFVRISGALQSGKRFILRACGSGHGITANVVQCNPLGQEQHHMQQQSHPISTWPSLLLCLTYRCINLSVAWSGKANEQCGKQG